MKHLSKDMIGKEVVFDHGLGMQSDVVVDIVDDHAEVEVVVKKMVYKDYIFPRSFPEEMKDG